MNERLLTDEEIREVWDTVDFQRHRNTGYADDYYKSDHEKVSEYDRATLKIQDTKTLKAVGEWLGERAGVQWVSVMRYEIEALKRGEFPDEK
jgi:hypothetical protein